MSLRLKPRRAGAIRELGERGVEDRFWTTEEGPDGSWSVVERVEPPGKSSRWGTLIEGILTNWP